MSAPLADAAATELDVGPAATVCAVPPRPSRPLRIGLGLLLAFVVVRLFVAEPVVTHGTSMEPTLRDGDVLVIEKISYRLHEPTVGEIVVASAPDGSGAVVKRVVAVGGDSIGIEDGVLVRNGARVAEPYANQEQMAGYYWGPVKVPAGTVFLLGDHRLESHDSRAYGPVDVDAIHGRYVLRIWPL